MLWSSSSSLASFTCFVYIPGSCNLCTQLVNAGRRLEWLDEGGTAGVGGGGGAVKERWQAGSQVLHWLPRWAKMQRCGDAGLRESVWVWEDVAASNLHRTMRWHTSSANVRPEDNREIEAARDPKDSRMQGSRAKTELPASLSQKSVKCPGWLWHGWAARRSSSRSTSLAVL